MPYLLWRHLWYRGVDLYGALLWEHKVRRNLRRVSARIIALALFRA